MAVCGGCGAESSRIRVTFRGAEKEEYCKLCRPEEFDRWVDPSNTRGGFRWQYEPQKYIKRDLPDGRVMYEAKDERNADLEAQLAAPNEYEEQRKLAAYEKKRQGRRTIPLTPAEVEQAKNRILRRREPRSPLAI